MSEIPTYEIYKLVLDISRSVARLEASIDELLIETRMLNRDLSSNRQHFAVLSQNFFAVFPT
jgi:hypothetical protein